MVFRVRLHVEPTGSGLAYLAAIDPGDFVMMRRMMWGIKRRAESLPTPPQPVALEPGGPVSA
jgi:hypothetical protein